MLSARLILLGLLLGLGAPLSALPYDNGVVTVADREFYVGEVTQEYTRLLDRFSEDGTDNTRVFVWRFSEQLKRIMAETPVLKGQGIEFLQTGMPADQLINNPPWLEALGFEENQNSLHTSNNHAVLSNGHSDFRLLPVNSDLTYSAFCVKSFEPGRLRICSLRVKYPYATHVAIIAEDLNPGTLLEASVDFEAIAREMIQIAVCIDITDRELSAEDREGFYAQLAEDGFDNCKIDLTS